MTTLSMRRKHRIIQDLASLDKLAYSNPRFSWRRSGHGLVFRYTGTPGLVRTRAGIGVWDMWSVLIRLGPTYPVQSPTAFLVPVSGVGGPWHPNTLAEPPHPVCFGRHLPVALLDELARRMERIIILEPHTIMVDERDAMNPHACALVRRLIRERAAPLTLDGSLPDWCRGDPAPVTER